MNFEILYTNTMQDDISMIDIINKTTQQINTLINNDLFFDSKGTRNVKSNIKKVMYYWVNAESGSKKSQILIECFQSFYNSLFYLLIKKRKYKYLYQGTVYRYLGNFSDSENLEDKIEYNDIFVPWSKNKNVIKCLEYKLHAPYIKLTTKINGNNFGIDLKKFGIQKNEEREVVYPTKRENIIDVQII